MLVWSAKLISDPFSLVVQYGRPNVCHFHNTAWKWMFLKWQINENLCNFYFSSLWYYGSKEKNIYIYMRLTNVVKILQKTKYVQFMCIYIYLCAMGDVFSLPYKNKINFENIWSYLKKFQMDCKNFVLTLVMFACVILSYTFLFKK